MRCAKCSEIRSDELFLGDAHPLQHSMQALKDSADAGCDICMLCWTCVTQRYDEKALGFLLGGLDTDGTEVSDSSVWLRGRVFPSPPHSRIGRNNGGDPGNAIYIVLGMTTQESQLAELKIFADPGTPAANTYSEIWTTVDRNPRLHIDFARKWMDECRTKHKLCTSNFLCSERSEMPTRLIDIGEPGDRGRRSVRLVITRKSDVQAPYVALSYCWGTSTSSTLMLREQNLSELQWHIDEEQLPKTHRDAFQLARDLGFRYVWIDALCIVQGSRDDWEYESRRMAQVYGNSALTIIAGRAADSQEGFLENRLQQSVGPCAISFYGEDRYKGVPRSEIRELGKIWLSLPRSLKYGPVFERGWCFQEEMLSSRALIFGEEQLAFQCHELKIREDGRAGRPEAYRIRSAYDDAYAAVGPDFKPLGPMRLDDDEVARRWLVFWYIGVLWSYPARKLTDQDDVFAAISGLAQVAKRKIRSRYLAGLWEIDMVRGLLWMSYLPMERQRRMTVVPRPQNGNEAQEIPTEVPSWSWAAIQGQVRVEHMSRNEAKYHESNWMVRLKYDGRWTRDTSCHATAVHIKSCELEFFGRPRRVMCIGKIKGASPKPKRGYMVDLVPMEENEADQEKKDNNNQCSEDANHVVAAGYFDVAYERVDSCWCLPLTRTEGLILVRDDRDKFRRLGTMKIHDLGWMMSAEEVEVCLV